MPPQPVITLDVEGVFFKTRISTLKSIEGTYFSRLFETDWREQLDREGKLFIDRDSSVFPVILNFLRDHEKCPLPNDEYHLMRLLREAVFFKIGPLRNLIEHKLRTSFGSSCTCPPELPSTPIPATVQKENIPRILLSKPPPPPPPPPPPSLIQKEIVQIPMRKPPVDRSSKKVKKSAVDSISLPRNFTHIAHVGWNGASVLFDKKMSDDPTVKKICDAAAEAVDLNAVYNVVNKNDAEESHSVEVLITGGVMQSRDGTSRH
uniref:BTB_2 domain-containing protein n=1 Tax=Caenorhabditis japonica TaxID=281687 RepID=A0A8R1HUE5_CAEJA